MVLRHRPVWCVRSSGFLLRALILATATGLAASGGAGAEPAPAPSPAAARRQPDILLVSIDSLRFDHLGCYGYGPSTSPSIDRLAKGGVRFSTAISTSSWTLPAHAALLTGLYDSTHGLVDNNLRLSDDHVTLAEALKEAGYQTAGFYGGPYLHPTFGLSQGFDHYQSCMTRLPDDLSGADARAESRAAAGATHGDVTGPRTVAEVSRWLQTASARPLFLFVHLWDVHYDYIAPARYVRMFDPDYRGALDGRNLMGNETVNAAMAPRDLKHLIALYDAEIRFTDDTVAALFGLLAKRGRLEDTLIVVTADHGEEFFEHGGKGHQRTLFDEVVRVPLIVSWPGHLKAGQVVTDQVRLIDVMPTLLALAGASHPPPMEGRDLTPLLDGGALPPQSAMSELLVDGRSMRSLRTPVFKFIEQGPGLPSGGFDLVADPGERHPIPPGRPAVAAGLADLARAIDDALLFRARLARAPERSQPDAETQRRLRSLGYVGGSGGGGTTEDDTPH